jgi:hypothetical protein
MIAAEEGNHGVADMCAWWDVSRSGYYDRLVRHGTGGRPGDSPFDHA